MYPKHLTVVGAAPSPANDSVDARCLVEVESLESGRYSYVGYCERPQA
jgi:hypothetical protein